MPSPSARTTRMLAIACPVILGLTLLWRLTLARQGAMLNADEGFYLASAQATLEGKLPYFDYAYTQGPFYPLLNAPLVAAFGPSLSSIRWISLLWTCLGLALAFFMMKGKDHPVLASLGLAPLVVSPGVLAELVIGKTYPLAQALLLCCAASLLIPMKPKARFWCYSFFGVLAAGSRMTLLPCVALIGLGLCWLEWRRLSPLWMLLIPLVTGTLLFGPFYFGAQEAFWFFNWDFHHAVTILKHPPGFAAQNWVFAPACWALGLAGTVHLWRSRKSDTAGCILLGSALVGIVFNLVVVGMYAAYLAPFILLLLIGSGRLLLFSPLHLPWRLSFVFLALLCGIAFKGPLPRPADVTNALSFADTPAAFLREHTQPGDMVLASMPEIPLAAGRRLYADLVMGKFAVTSELKPEFARRMKFLTFSDLETAATRREPAAIVVSRWMSWNFLWSLPSVRIEGPGRDRFWDAVSRNYSLAYVNEIYVILLRRNVPLDARPKDFPTL